MLPMNMFENFFDFSIVYNLAIILFASKVSRLRILTDYKSPILENSEPSNGLFGIR